VARSAIGGLVPDDGAANSSDDESNGSTDDSATDGARDSAAHHAVFVSKS
jgi:hypothetical protein